jgi:hypothetical protein
MKAEHRKELETNILADRMGHLIQRIKHRPQRRVFLYVIAGLILAVALFVFYNMRKSAAADESERWRWLEDGFRPYIDQLKSEYKDTNAGKAARFQYAWLAAWGEGMMLVGASPVEAFRDLEVAEHYYKGLEEDCAGDPVWEVEALYGQAIIEEARALRVKTRSDHIDRARALYEKLADKYKDSAHGKSARKRAKFLKENGKEVAEFYANLESRLDVEGRFFEADQALKERLPKKNEPAPKKTEPAPKKKK